VSNLLGFCHRAFPLIPLLNLSKGLQKQGQRRRYRKVSEALRYLGDNHILKDRSILIFAAINRGTGEKFFLRRRKAVNFLQESCLSFFFLCRRKKIVFFPKKHPFFFKLGSSAVLLRVEQQHMVAHCCCSTDFNPML
jgi:hypothetical protein